MEKEETQATSDTEKSDTLVVYFSRTGEQFTVGVIEEGNTAIVAKMIAEKTGADLFEVLPADDHYPMTYEELTEVALHEQDENARPEYAGDVPDSIVKDGLAVRGNDAQNDQESTRHTVNDWLSMLGY